MRHVPRTYNERANDLAQGCLKLELEKRIREQQDQVFFLSADVVSDLQCIICGSVEGQDMVICDLCGQGQHQKCLGDLSLPSKGAFFCKNCENYIYDGAAEGKGDVTLDVNLMDYLENPAVRLPPGEKVRCKKLAQVYFLKDGQLLFRMENGVRRVPTVSERHLWTLQIHQQLGHSGVAATLQQVKAHYFWPGMARDVKDLIKACLICQSKKGHYLPHAAVTPLPKGLTIWTFIALDLIEVKANADPNQKRKPAFVLSCIDAYSKCPELIVLPNKQAVSVRDAFYSNVVYRYGKPAIVRSDGGREFLGKFDEALRTSGINHVKLGPAYPQSNGQIERLNQVIKSKLQALYNSEEYSDKWAALIPLISFAIRITRSRATGYSPYEIMYGRDPQIPGHGIEIVTEAFEEPCQERLTYLIDQLMEAHQLRDQRIRQNLQQMDEEIIKTVGKREFLKVTELQFGQPIFVRSRKATKLQHETTGVHYFVKFMTPAKDMILYYNGSSQRFLTANISNVKVGDIPPTSD